MGLVSLFCLLVAVRTTIRERLGLRDTLENTRRYSLKSFLPAQLAKYSYFTLLIFEPTHLITIPPLLLPLLLHLLTSVFSQPHEPKCPRTSTRKWRNPRMETMRLLASQYEMDPLQMKWMSTFQL